MSKGTDPIRTRRHFLYTMAVGTAGLSVGQNQRDVRVVGAGQRVVDERARVRIPGSDALIVSDLVRERPRPAPDQTPCVRPQRCVRGIDPDLAARHVAGDTVGLAIMP